jgi:hypothetical protein
MTWAGSPWNKTGVEQHTKDVYLNYTHDLYFVRSVIYFQNSFFYTLFRNMYIYKQQLQIYTKIKRNKKYYRK